MCATDMEEKVISDLNAHWRKKERKLTIAE